MASYCARSSSAEVKFKFEQIGNFLETLLFIYIFKIINYYVSCYFYCYFQCKKSPPKNRSLSSASGMNSEESEYFSAEEASISKQYKVLFYTVFDIYFIF